MMMRKPTLWPIASFFAVLFIGAPAYAQQSFDKTPQLEPLNEDAAPAVTIRSNTDSRQITETRERGRVTDVRVRSGDSSYNIKPNTPAGNAFPGDVQSNTTRAPQWQVMEFEWGRKQEDNPAIKHSVTAPPPPSPNSIDAANPLDK